MPNINISFVLNTPSLTFLKLTKVQVQDPSVFRITSLFETKIEICINYDRLAPGFKSIYAEIISIPA